MSDQDGSSHWKKPAQWAGIIILVIVAAVGTIFGFVQTGPGRSLLATTLSNLVSGPGQKIEIRTIEGLVPFDMYIGMVNAADADGIWLKVENVALRLSVLPIFHGMLHVEELTVAKLHLERKPSSAAAEEPGKAEVPTIPSFLKEEWPIRVERLLVSELLLGEAVAGRNANFRVEAGMEETALGRGRRTFLHFERTDEGPKTRADLSVLVEGDPPVLKVDVSVNEESEGVAAAMLGLGPGPLFLDVRGSGPVADWKGTVQGSAGPYGSITTQVILRSRQEIVLSLDGKLELAEPLLPPRLAPVLGGSNFFGLTVNSSPQMFIIEEARFWGKGYQGLLSGSLDRKSEAIAGQWRFAMDNIGVVDEYAGNFEGKLSISGSVKGKLRRPEGDSSIVLQKFHTGGVLMEEIRTDLKLEPLDGSGASASGFRLTGNTSAKGVSISSSEPMDRVLDWSMEVDNLWSRDPLKVRVRAGNSPPLMGGGEPGFLDLSGEVDVAKKSGTLEASLRIENLNDLTGPLGRELPGKPEVKLDLRANVSAGSGSGQFKGEISGLRAEKTPVLALFSPGTEFSGDLQFKDTLIILSGFKVENPSLAFDAKGTADVSKNELDGEWHLKVPKIEKPAREAGLNASGEIEAQGTVSGNVKSLEHVISIKGGDLVIDDRKLQKVTANFRARNVPETPNGDLRIELHREGEALSVSTDFTLQRKELSLQKLRIGTPGGELKGDLAVDVQTKTARGRLEGNLANLAAVGRLTGEPLSGAATIRISADRKEKGIELKANVTGNELSTRFGGVKRLTLSADLSDLPNSPRGKMSLALQELESQGLALRDMSLKASGSGKGMDFDLSGKGHYREQFDLETRGTLTWAGGADQLRISHFTGEFGDYPFKLSQPLAMQRSNGNISFEKFAIGIGRGQVSASGRLETKGVLLNAELENILLGTPSSSGAARFSATAGGKLRIEGPLSKPSASFNGRLTDIRPSGPLAKDQRPPPLDFEIGLAGGRATVNARMQGSGDENVKAVLSASVEFSLSPFAFSLPPGGRLEGEIEGRTNLARISSLVPLRGHEISGPATGRFTLGGTLGDPRIEGNMRVEKGLYQNLDYGSALKELTIDVSARGRRLEIERMRATDGGRGVLTADGFVEVDPAGNFPMEIKVAISNMALIRRPDATGTIDGSLTVSGSIARMAVGGQFEVKSAEVLLKGALPPSIVHLDVIETGGGRPAPQPGQEREASPALNLELNLRVNIPGNVFVRGRGLDSEWRGDLAVTGTGGKQAVTGNFNTVRGTFDFLGKRFTVTRGVIAFHGAVPPAPTIDVTAESRAKDITARLLLQGMVSSPDIKLESDPPFPPDEILSRVLFNRASGNLTPMQALRLADALRSLSGRGHTLDFLGRTREFLGLGQLEFRETGITSPGQKNKSEAEGQTALGIGKYLTEDIYVDVEKGIGNESGKASVTVEVTPNFSVEAEAGLDSRQGIGLNWKHDY